MYDDWSVRKGELNNSIDLQNETRAQRATFEIRCSWCGALIRSSAEELPEQMCLICHARMLNDYFQRLRKTSGEKRTSRRV
jgi:hypothetical protein